MMNSSFPYNIVPFERKYCVLKRNEIILKDVYAET